MTIRPAVPIGQDLKLCGECNGFGARIELEVVKGTAQPTGRLIRCGTCKGAGVRPDGPPLVDPALGTPKGHGVD